MAKNLYNKKLTKLARNLRTNSTPGEITLWNNVLKNKKFYNYQFNRQFPIGNFIVDFICRRLSLIIEIDGYSHIFKYEKDKKREDFLRLQGYNILRFKESEVKNDLNNVIRAMEAYLEDFNNTDNTNLDKKNPHSTL